MAERMPLEIRAALDAFDTETKQAIVITLLDESTLAFSELKRQLSTEDDQLHNQTLTNALRDLQRGGLINKRAPNEEDSEFDAYYEVSEYGERFVHCLLESLGSVDSFEKSKAEYTPVEHIHSQDGHEPVLMEAYHVTEGESTAGDDRQTLRPQ